MSTVLRSVFAANQAGAMPNSSPVASVTPSARSIANIVATAFDEAAPMPPCTGKCFSISMTILLRPVV